MADLGGGTESYARSNQFEYRANSRPDDDTHEAETLWGRIDPRSFGHRAVRNKPPPEHEDANSRWKRRLGDGGLPSRGAKRSRRGPTHQDVSVLSLTDDVVYKPQTKEARAAYKALLSTIQQQLGGQPLGLLAGAADEALATLKNDKIKNPDKKEEIEKLIGTISKRGDYIHT